MKRLIASLAGALIIAGSPCIQAAGTTDVSVKGTITPTACSPSFSEGGLLDFGKISVNQLDPINNTLLPKVSMQLAVNCDAASLFAMHVVDNQLEGEYWIGAFSLGVNKEKQKIGGYYLQVGSAMGDGVQVTPLASTDGGLSWEYLPPSADWAPGILAGFGKRQTTPHVPIPIQDLRLDMAIEISLSPTRWLSVTEDVPANGSATLELRYL